MSSSPLFAVSWLGRVNIFVFVKRHEHSITMDMSVTCSYFIYLLFVFLIQSVVTTYLQQLQLGVLQLSFQFVLHFLQRPLIDCGDAELFFLQHDVLGTPEEEGGGEMRRQIENFCELMSLFNIRVWLRDGANSTLCV